MKGLSRDILRQVIVAAKLPLRVSGVLQKVPQLKSALLAFLLSLPEEQEEAGWGQCSTVSRMAIAHSKDQHWNLRKRCFDGFMIWACCLVVLYTKTLTQVTWIEVFREELSRRQIFLVLYRDNTKSSFQAASSSSHGLEQLRVLKELAAGDGKDRVESAVKGLSRDILRQVTVAAKLPLRASGELQTLEPLQSALLAFLLNLPEEQEEAGWGQM